MRSVRPAELEQSLDLVYEAAADPANWRPALEALARATGAEGVLMMVDPLAKGPTAFNSAGLDRSMPAFLQDDRFLHNQIAARAVGAAHHGEFVITEATLYTPDGYRREPMHMEFLQPEGLGWYAGLTMLGSMGTTVQISLQRRFVDEPYSRQEIEQLSAVMPHLRRAMRLACVLGTERDAGTMDAFGQLGIAALLLDNSGAVTRVNRHAEPLLHDGLTVTAGQLTARSFEAAAALRAMIAGLVSANRDSPHLGPIRVPRRTGSPVAVHGTPLLGAARSPFGGAAAIIVIVDPDAHTPGAELWLERACSLTRAEARTAALLAAGLDLSEIATARGVALSTIRTQVAEIATKTGANTRGQQVALFSRLLLRAPQPG